MNKSTKKSEEKTDIDIFLATFTSAQQASAALLLCI